MRLFFQYKYFKDSLVRDRPILKASVRFSVTGGGVKVTLRIVILNLRTHSLMLADWSELREQYSELRTVAMRVATRINILPNNFQCVGQLASFTEYFS